MATKMKYCEPPHSIESEYFDVYITGSYTTEYIINEDCLGLFAPDSDPIEPPPPVNSDTAPFGCFPKYVGCYLCEGYDSHLFSEELKNPIVFLEFKNAVIGWKYKFNILVTIERYEIRITAGPEGTSDCNANVEGKRQSTTVFPVEFIPDSTSGKIGPIKLDGFSGGCINLELEYVPCT